MRERMNTALPDGMTPLLVTTAQAATLLQISAAEVTRMVRDSKIPVVRYGRLVRIAVGDLEDWIDRNRKYEISAISENVVALRRRKPSTDTSRAVRAATSVLEAGGRL
jgi:excisionase family DNA binding protein